MNTTIIPNYRRVTHSTEHRSGYVLAEYTDKNGFNYAVVDWDDRLDPPEIILTSRLEPETKSREDVYKAIDTEREYQNTLPRNEIKNQTIMEYMALIRHILVQMDNDWYNKSEQVSLDYVRKIAGIAVRCMEEHGAPKRKN